MRLDKFICECSNASRKEAKDLCKKNRIRVNDQIIKDPSININIDLDNVFLDGKLLVYEEFVYYMLNKPANVVSATKDNLDKTVIDLFLSEGRKDLFPVGRLDKDTVGLLIITNDGNFSHHITSPNHDVFKKYYLKISKPLSENEIKILESGVVLVGDGITKPAKVEVISENEIYLSISEGMFHQVKRMLKAVGNEVLFLKRISIGNVKLDENLLEGQYRRLTQEEIDSLKK